MADVKITALTAISANPVNPATFPMPMVDLLDTSMAASGSTRKVTVNQILGSGGTATLASATITGDLTVDTSTLKVDSTNNRVGIGTASPGAALEVSGSATNIFIRSTDTNDSALRYYVNGTEVAVCRGKNGGSYAIETAGVERLRIDSSGNVGIGVTPSAWDTNYKALQLGFPNFIAGNNGGNIIDIGVNAYFNTDWKYAASSVAATRYRQVVGVHQWYTAPSGTAGNAITFTQAMTLDASGNLLVGTTTNTNSSRVFARGTGGATTLAIQSSIGDTANPGLLVGKFDNDSTTSQILVRFTINNNASGSGQITANGANAAAFGTFSDSRLKENITSIPSQLAKILSLRPVEFDFKNGSGHQIGFVAQEMQEVYPDVVGEQDGFLTVTGWSKTEARLVSAIKELAAKVQALEAKLA